MNPLERAIAGFLAYPPGDHPIGPPVTFRVPEDAQVTFGTGPASPLHGMAIASWPEGTDQ